MESRAGCCENENPRQDKSCDHPREISQNDSNREIHPHAVDNSRTKIDRSGDATRYHEGDKLP